MKRTEGQNNPLATCVRVSSPNHQMLSQLVVLAKGDRSLTQFAKVCGVHVSTLSRIVNMQTTKPSSDALIKAIADHAAPGSGVTLEKMLVAHGVAPVIVETGVEGNLEATVVRVDRTETNPEKAKEISEKAVKELQKNYGNQITLSIGICKEIMSYYLINQGYSVKLSEERNIIYSTEKLKARADFVLETDAFEDAGLTKWAMDVHFGDKRPLMHKLCWLFGTAYLESPLKNGIKASLIVTDKDEFEDAKDRLMDVRIEDVISLILVDINKRTVLEEFFVPMKD